MPGGYTPTLPILGIVHISQRPNDHFFSALFSRAYALFQVTYPVSPLLATLTKTAGCIPTIPILAHPECYRAERSLSSIPPLPYRSVPPITNHAARFPQTS